MQEKNKKISPYYKYLIEAILFFTYAVFGMTWSAAGSLLPEIMSELSLDISEASFINTSVTIAKIFGPVLAGFIAYRLGLRWAFMLASGLICTGILAPLAPNYITLLLARFSMGLGGSLVVVFFTPLVMQWFSDEERPVINGFNYFSISVGMTLGLSITQYAMDSMGGSWKKVLLLYSSISIVMAVLWLLLGRDKDGYKANSQDKKASGLTGFIDALKDVNTWKLTFSYSGLLAIYIVIITYFPTFYRNIPHLSKDSLVLQAPAITMVSAIPASFLGMALAGKIGLRVPFVRYAGLFFVPGFLGMFLFQNPYIILISSAVTGISMFIWRPAFFTIPQELPGATPQKAVNMMSVFWAVSYIVATLVTWLVGKITEISGSFITGFIIASIAGTSMFIGSFFLKETGKKPKNEL